MTIVLVRQDLSRLLSGGRAEDGSQNRGLINHACKSSGVALCFADGAGDLTYLYRALEGAREEIVASNPLLASVKLPEFDTISKIASCNEPSSLDAIGRAHLWIEAAAKHPNPSPTLARLKEAVHEIFSGQGLPDNSVHICLNVFDANVSKAFRDSIAKKTNSPLSSVSALSNAIFKSNRDITESAKPHVLLYLEQGPKGAKGRQYRISDQLAKIVDGAYSKVAKDLNLPPPVNLVRYGATEGPASGRGTAALSISNGNLVPLAAKA